MYLLKKHALRAESLKKSVQVPASPYQQMLVSLCNDEWLAYYQYWASASLAEDDRLKAELLEHAQQEREHAGRIEGLLKKYGLSPERQFSGILANSNCGYQMPETVTDPALLESNLAAEMCAIDAYEHALAVADGYDGQVLLEILDDEQEHAADLLRIRTILAGSKRALYLPLIKAARPLQGSIDFNGLQCSIETGRSRVRAWYDPHNDTSGMSLMRLPYGYVKGTMGVDGDQYDVFIGPDRTAPNVYIVTTMAPPTFDEVDEQKAFLGLPSAEEAERIFRASYNDPRFFGNIVTMPFEEFKGQVLSTKDNPRLLGGAR